jgi:hypothetical protein
MERGPMMVGMTVIEAFPSLVAILFLCSPFRPMLTSAKHMSLIKCQHSYEQNDCIIGRGSVTAQGRWGECYPWDVFPCPHRKHPTMEASRFCCYMQVGCMAALHPLQKAALIPMIDFHFLLLSDSKTVHLCYFFHLTFWNCNCFSINCTFIIPFNTKFSPNPSNSFTDGQTELPHYAFISCILYKEHIKIDRLNKAES